jgi:bifunctional DNase/RNase
MGMLPFVITKNSGVTLSNGASVVILKVGEAHFPIIMTPFDGKCVISMAAELDFYDQAFPNVVGRLLDEFGVSLDRIEIVNEVVNDPTEEPAEQSLPVMYLRKGEKEIAITAFAGDAIALALARRVPMFIDEKVFMRGIESERVKELMEMIWETVPEILED